jgi:SHS2 domain-containing protein
MSYKILEHTADVRLRATGRNQTELFVDALAGMMAILKPREKTPAMVSSRVIETQASDATNLLVDFLSGVLTLAQIHREGYPRVEFHELSDTTLRAELTGMPVEEFGKDIKAVTYHEAEIHKNERGELETIIVFDI